MASPVWGWCQPYMVMPKGRPSECSGVDSSEAENMMGAERGWIVDPPPQREHHTPGWLSEKGTGRSHFHPEPLEEQDADAKE
jgi:hypothetical protein